MNIYLMKIAVFIIMNFNDNKASNIIHFININLLINIYYLEKIKPIKQKRDTVRIQTNYLFQFKKIKDHGWKPRRLQEILSFWRYAFGHSSYFSLDS